MTALDAERLARAQARVTVVARMLQVLEEIGPTGDDHGVERATLLLEAAGAAVAQALQATAAASGDARPAATRTEDLLRAVVRGFHDALALARLAGEPTRAQLIETLTPLGSERDAITPALLERMVKDRLQRQRIDLAALATPVVPVSTIGPQGPVEGALEPGPPLQEKITDPRMFAALMALMDAIAQAVIVPAAAEVARGVPGSEGKVSLRDLGMAAAALPFQVLSRFAAAVGPGELAAIGAASREAAQAWSQVYAQLPHLGRIDCASA